MNVMRWVGACVLAAAVAACANQKAPAEAAVKAAQDSVSAVSAEAQKYVPDQLRGIQDALSGAQAALVKGDYAAALTQAQAIPTQVASLQTAIADKKIQLTRAWTDMSSQVPQLVGALKSRVDVLSQSKGVPKGLTKEGIESAKTGLTTVTQTWTDASAAAASGDMATAVSKGTQAKTQVMDVMRSLNMQIPGGVTK